MEDNNIIPFRVVSHTFLDGKDGLYTYEITFNQSLVHTGRFTGIQDGLNAYREKEIKEQEALILQQADKIRNRTNA